MALNLLGIQLRILIGKGTPLPAPANIIDALQSVEVTHSTEGRSAAQIAFQIGRSGQGALMDYALARDPLLEFHNRILLTVYFNTRPHILLDGFITDRQFSLSSEPGASTVTVTAEDVSLKMDMNNTFKEGPSQSDKEIVETILGEYTDIIQKTEVDEPPQQERPSTNERVPKKRGTHLTVVKNLAAHYGYVFYVTPGPAPLTNTAYWGPPKRSGQPQPPLSVNMGPETNVERIDIWDNSLAPTLVSGHALDLASGQNLPVKTVASTLTPLARRSGLMAAPGNVRTEQPEKACGGDYASVLARAQAKTNASVEDAVTVTGELDALRYNGLLRPREIVKLRGAGMTYSGEYKVNKVTHKIKKGDYQQQFTLSREGTGAL